MLSRAIHQRVLVDPPHAGGVRADLGAHSLRKSRQDLAQILEDAAARPVEVGAVLEDDVDVGEAEVGKAADGFHLGRTQESRDDRIGDLVLQDVGAPVPA